MDINNHCSVVLKTLFDEYQHIILGHIHACTYILTPFFFIFHNKNPPKWRRTRIQLARGRRGRPPPGSTPRRRDSTTRHCSGGGSYWARARVAVAACGRARCRGGQHGGSHLGRGSRCRWRTQQYHEFGWGRGRGSGWVHVAPQLPLLPWG